MAHASLANFKLAAERGLITHLNVGGCLQPKLAHRRASEAEIKNRDVPDEAFAVLRLELLAGWR